MPTLTFLIGPTAVGKTALGVAWAKQTGGEILYADAPCVFKGMDIGTAKPTPAEREAVPHHGLDWAEINERFTVGDYATKAAAVVSDVTAHGKPLLILGGSGFYLRSYFEPTTDGLGISPEVVTEVTQIEKTEGLSGLVARLRAACPGDALTGLDLQNPRRVAKALERVLSSGRPYHELKVFFEALPKPFAGFNKKVIQLHRSREDLKSRITLRAKAMLACGLLDEVKLLESKGLQNNPQASAAIGYRESLNFLAGKLATHEELLSAIIQNSLALVRKQETFFKLLPVSKLVTLLAGQSANPDVFD